MRWIGVPAVLAALALAVAGCGGSDSSSEAEGSDDTVTIETVADDSTTTDAMEPDETEPTAPDLDLSGSGLSDECQELVEASAEYAEAFSQIGTETFDLQGSAEAIQAIADSAPEEIRDAFQTLAAAVATYAEALEGVDLTSGATPDPETLAKITQATQVFSSADVAEASQAISTWTEENCGTAVPAP